MLSVLSSAIVITLLCLTLSKCTLMPVSLIRPLVSYVKGEIARDCVSHILGEREAGRHICSTVNTHEQEPSGLGSCIF